MYPRKVHGKSHGLYVITATEISLLKPLKPGSQYCLLGSTADGASYIIFPEGVRNTCVKEMCQGSKEKENITAYFN